jgi:4-amino-4-deoxy-L-arabinose transferase-like glycosyltransferase
MTATQLTEPPTRSSPISLGVWVALIFLVGLACFVPLPANSPLAGTEGHRALTAHQMVESGEWLVPRMFGRVYLAKPPLHYWIIASFERISGLATPFVWRLPSAVEGALLAAAVSWFAGRWFGSIASPIAGLSYIALIAMWGEDRGADIDITNALSCTVAALCLLELVVGPTAERGGRAIWIIAATLAIAASFLTKGPCGLPVILGAMIWIAVIRIRGRAPHQLASPAFWLPLVGGILIFLLYALATYWYIRAHHMAADWTGVQEGTEDLHPHDWSIRRAIEWILLAPTMFVYALPVSLALPLAFNRSIRAAHDAGGQSRMAALAWTILLSWAVCFVSGMHLPRYAYITLPLMCPLAGAVGITAPLLAAKWRQLFAWIVAAAGFIFFAVAVVLTGICWTHAPWRLQMVVADAIALAALLYALPAILGSRPEWRRVPLPLASILICLGFDYGIAGHYDHLRRSSLAQGQTIRFVTGPDAHLATCAMVLDQPELFYYSGLPTKAYDGDALDWRNITPGTWVVLEPQELQIWKREVPDRLQRSIFFIANKNPGFLIWYNSAPATGP